MKIGKINNLSNQHNYELRPQFGARFNHSQLVQMLEPNYRSGSAKNMYEYVPKLYTLLERLEKIMLGEKATFKIATDNSGETVDILEIGGKIFHKEHFDINNSEIKLLENALIDGMEPNGVRNNDRAYMPQRIYEQKWWDNVEKTEADILNDFQYETIEG